MSEKNNLVIMLDYWVEDKNGEPKHLQQTVRVTVEKTIHLDPSPKASITVV